MASRIFVLLSDVAERQMSFLAMIVDSLFLREDGTLTRLTIELDGERMQV